MTILEVICKTVAMQNNSMALLHVSHPPAQTFGGEDILYIYIYFFFLIFTGHQVLDPITNPYLLPTLAAPYNNLSTLTSDVLSFSDSPHPM